MTGWIGVHTVTLVEAHVPVEEQTRPEGQGSLVRGLGVVDVQVQVDLLRTSVGPLRWHVVRGELHAHLPVTVGGEHALEGLVTDDVPVEHARPEGALGVDIGSIEDHHMAHDLHVRNVARGRVIRASPGSRPRMDITWIGAATTLIRHQGVTVLTDPSFLHAGQRVYLGKGLWTRRLVEPSHQPHELGPVDAIVLSHMHGDHWDRVAQRSLDPDLPVISTPASARALRRQGFERAVGLASWSSHDVSLRRGTVRVTAVPGRHAKGPGAGLLPPVMGSVLTFADGATVYITGDTLLVDELRAMPDRFPRLDVGLWHLGGTRVLGMLATMDAQQGADLLELVRPRACVPVHHGDFGVFKDPVENFYAEVTRRGLPGVRAVERGETLHLDDVTVRSRETH